MMREYEYVVRIRTTDERDNAPEHLEEALRRCVHSTFHATDVDIEPNH